MSAISADGAVVDCQYAAVVDATAECVAAEVGAIPADSAVTNRQRPAVINAATFIGAIPADGTFADRHRPIADEDAATVTVAQSSARKDNLATGAIPADGAVGERQRPAVYDAATVGNALVCASGQGLIPA